MSRPGSVRRYLGSAGRTFRTTPPVNFCGDSGGSDGETTGRRGRRSSAEWSEIPAPGSAQGSARARSGTFCASLRKRLTGSDDECRNALVGSGECIFYIVVQSPLPHSCDRRPPRAIGAGVFVLRRSILSRPTQNRRDAVRHLPGDRTIRTLTDCLGANARWEDGAPDPRHGAGSRWALAGEVTLASGPAPEHGPGRGVRRARTSGNRDTDRSGVFSLGLREN